MLPALIHAHHNRHLEDLPFWLELADQAGDPVLELGCGTGRVLIPLARAGHNAIGLDNDPEMLVVLKANIGSQKMPAPRFLMADISAFNLGAHFQLIILPCNTFSILPQNKRLACLECVRKHLKAGGVFAVSIPNPELLRVLPARAEAEVEDEFPHPQTGNPVQVSSSWRRTKHTFTVTWTYDQLLPDGRVERFAVEAAHHIIPAQDYLDEIRHTGLQITKTYGDFDHSAYNKDSPSLIYVATI